MNWFHAVQEFQTFESHVLFILRFMVDKNLGSGTWIRIPQGEYFEDGVRTSYCNIEIDISYQDIQTLGFDNEWSFIVPLRCLSMDLEAQGQEGHFPNPETDPCIQIGTTFQITNGNETTGKPLYVIHALRTCAPIDSTNLPDFCDQDNPPFLISHETEAEMLLNWADMVTSLDPDLLVGYNITDFDYPYLIKRSKALRIEDQFILGRIKNQTCDMKTRTKDSQTQGKRETCEVTVPGRVLFDILPLAREESVRLRSYTLNSVAWHYLQLQKADVHHTFIPKLQNGSDKDRTRLAIYCLKDTYLPLRLMEKRMYIINYFEFARVTGITLSLLLQRGQQMKIFSKILRESKKQNMLVPTLEHKNEEAYKGAVVLNPVAGYYDQAQPITVLDFCSLYPSIMIAYNLCFCTWIQHPLSYTRPFLEENTNLSPVGHHFVKTSTKVGILPTILKEILAARSQAKKWMKQEKDPFRKAVFDGRQLALKRCANSVYGFTGAAHGLLTCIPISSSVTGYGRTMLTLSQSFLEKEYSIKNGFPFDCKVIYGDSVMGGTPIMLRDETSKQVQIRTIDTLCTSYLMGEKEIGMVDEHVYSHVYSDQGWTQVIRVIRHKTSKQIFRILTHTGLVDVTEDHSLLKSDGNVVKPTQVRVGDSLMHAFPPNVTCDSNNMNLSLDEAYVWGFFMNYGSCEWNGKYRWTMKHRDETLLIEVKARLEKVESPLKFKIVKHKLVPCAKLQYMVEKYRLLFYDENERRRIPFSIFNSTYAAREMYLEGYLASDKTKCQQYCHIKSQLLCQSLYYLLQSIGYHVSISWDEAHPHHHDMYRLTWTTTEKSRKSQNTIQKIIRLGTVTDYVYDLETENHHFNAGIGQLTVHNTDSVFIKFGFPDLKTCFHYGKEAAKKVSAQFSSPIELDFEKCYCPLLLLKKKKYGGVYWSQLEKYDRIDYKGLEVVRRETCKLVPSLCEQVMHQLLIEKNTTKAVEIVKNAVRDLYLDKVDMSQLIMRLGLGKDPSAKDYKANRAHVKLAQRMHKRDPTTAPRMGDPVWYVYVGSTKNSKSKQADVIEDPMYVLKHKIPLCPEEYVEKQLRKPLTRILEHILPAKQVEQLWTGKHTFCRKPPHSKAVGSNHGILKYMVRNRVCQHCQVVLLKTEKHGLCTKCEPLRATLTQEIKLEQKDLIETCQKLHTKCEDCQDGTPYKQIDCHNIDCDTFFSRNKMDENLSQCSARIQELF